MLLVVSELWRDAPHFQRGREKVKKIKMDADSHDPGVLSHLYYGLRSLYIPSTPHRVLQTQRQLLTSFVRYCTMRGQEERRGERTERISELFSPFFLFFSSLSYLSIPSLTYLD
jgi:hypothetical protein